MTSSRTLIAVLSVSISACASTATTTSSEDADAQLALDAPDDFGFGTFTCEAGPVDDCADGGIVSAVRLDPIRRCGEVVSLCFPGCFQDAIGCWIDGDGTVVTTHCTNDEGPPGYCHCPVAIDPPYPLCAP